MVWYSHLFENFTQFVVIHTVKGFGIVNNVRFQGKPFNITVIQVYAPTSNVEEAKVERFCEDLQDL